MINEHESYHDKRAPKAELSKNISLDAGWTSFYICPTLLGGGGGIPIPGLTACTASIPGREYVFPRTHFSGCNLKDHGRDAVRK